MAQAGFCEVQIKSRLPSQFTQALFLMSRTPSFLQIEFLGQKRASWLFWTQTAASQAGLQGPVEVGAGEATLALQGLLNAVADLTGGKDTLISIPRCLAEHTRCVRNAS